MFEEGRKSRVTHQEDWTAAPCGHDHRHPRRLGGGAVGRWSHVKCHWGSASSRNQAEKPASR